MATATMVVPMLASDIGDLTLTYDTASLLVQSITYQNRSRHPVELSLYHNGILLQDAQSGPDSTRTLPALTPSATVDVSSARVPMLLSGLLVLLPVGWSIGVRVPQDS